MNKLEKAKRALQALPKDKVIERAIKDIQEKIDEKPKYKVGTWYKSKSSDYIWCVKSITLTGGASIYGLMSQRWVYTDYVSDCYECVEATNSEVEAALISEAKRRYKKGDKVKSVVDVYSGSEVAGYFYRKSDYRIYGAEELDGGSVLYHNGIWATIIENKLEINGYKLEIIPVPKHGKYKTAKFGCAEISEDRLNDIHKALNSFNHGVDDKVWSNHNRKISSISPLSSPMPPLMSAS